MPVNTAASNMENNTTASRDQISSVSLSDTRQNSEELNGTSRGTKAQPLFAADASIVLVGIRGCGKRSLGLIAATALGRRFITEDHYFQTNTGLSRQDYLKLHGSEEFHKHDVEISCQMLEEYRSGCVIDCGLGSLTSTLQDYLRTYSSTNPVVHVLRDMESIRNILRLNDRSVKLLENGDSTHRRCTNFEYFNLEDNSADALADHEGLDRSSPVYSFKLRQAQADFSHFVKMITNSSSLNDGPQPAYSVDNPVYFRPFTHALRLPFTAYESNLVDLAKLEAAGDIVEVFIDRWKSGAAKVLSRLVADVRRTLQIPVLVTVSQKSSSLTADSYVHAVRHCMRLAVDFVSIDIDLDAKALTELRATRSPSRFVADVNLTRRALAESPWIDGTAKRHVEEAISQRYDLIRLSYEATSKDDNDDVKYFVHSLQQEKVQSPVIIACNTGKLGRTSQVFNKNLTPVTHETLQQLPPEYSQLTAQITARESTQALFQSFALDSLKFCIIGGNVSGSLSPVMHSAAYQLLGLNHTYTTKNIKSWEDVEELANDHQLGGASIVQPWKVRLVSRVAHLSEHARIIGAINTLIPLRSLPDGSIPALATQAASRNQSGPIAAWYGDNTDWIAMSSCISRSLSPRNVIQSKSTALVIGAGGMARAAVYALTKLGCRNVFVYNRTVRNAEILVEHYTSWFSNQEQTAASPAPSVKVIGSREEPWPLDYSPPTMVISCVTHEHLEGNPDSNFTMPTAWLASESGGVVLELAYMTRETPLTTQIKHHRQATGLPWVVVDGIETLFEQALAQFEIMTGKRAPPRCMRSALNKAIQERQTFVADGEEFEVVQ